MNVFFFAKYFYTFLEGNPNFYMEKMSKKEFFSHQWREQCSPNIFLAKKWVNLTLHCFVKINERCQKWLSGVYNVRVSRGEAKLRRSGLWVDWNQSLKKLKLWKLFSRKFSKFFDHFLTIIFGSGAYRGPKNRLYTILYI